MIKPVAISLRITAILGRTLLVVAVAPLQAVAEILNIVSEEVLVPTADQMEKFKEQLETTAKAERRAA